MGVKATQAHALFFCQFTSLPRFYGEVRQKPIAALDDQLKADAPEEAKEDTSRLILFTHYTFLVSVNGPKVIEISWEGSEDKSIDITDINENLAVGFTYTVKWKDVQTDYLDRAHK